MNRLRNILPLFALLASLGCGLRAAVAQPAPPEPPAHVAAGEEAVEREQEKIEERNRGWRNRPHPSRSFGQDLIVRTNETVGDLVLFGGTADIQGTVDGDLVMIGGNLKISGEVTRGVVLVGSGLELSGTIGRDAVVVMGGADLKGGAKIEGNAVLIGGPFKLSSESEIYGERQLIPLGDILPKVQWFKAWVVQGLLWGRLLPYGVTWPWFVAGFASLFYMLVLVLFPSGVKATYLALEQRPIASFAAGLLALILAAPLTVVLVMTVVGIAAIPFVKIALLLAIIVGKIGVICFLGRSIGRSLGGGLQAPFLAFIIGGILLTLIYTVPIIGLPAWGLATVFGLGAAIVALGNCLSREQAQVAPMAVPLSTVRPSTWPVMPATSHSRTASTPVPAPEASASDAGSILGAAAGPAAIGLQAPPIAVSAPGPADTLLLRRAGFWVRFLASLLDNILLALLIPIAGPLFIPIAIVYFVAMWTWKGTTLGSLVFGLKVIRTDGRPVNFAVALVRSLASIFSGLVLFLGFLWVAWDRDKQAWHDKIAGTIVVRMPKDFSLIGLF